MADPDLMLRGGGGGGGRRVVLLALPAFILLSFLLFSPKISPSPRFILTFKLVSTCDQRSLNGINRDIQIASIQEKVVHSTGKSEDLQTGTNAMEYPWTGWGISGK